MRNKHRQHRKLMTSLSSTIVSSRCLQLPVQVRIGDAAEAAAVAIAMGTYVVISWLFNVMNHPFKIKSVLAAV